MEARAASIDTDALEQARPRRLQLLRLLARKRIAAVAIVVIAVFYAAGLFAPLVAPHAPGRQVLSVEARLQPPSGEHLLGTDRLGRDILSRVIYAARTTTLFTLVITLTGGLFLGLGLGLLAGYRGGWVDAAVMRVGEVLAGFPTLFLMLAVSAAFRTRINDLAFWLKDNTFLGNDARPLVFFLLVVSVTTIFAWIGAARVVRSQALAIREQEYVLAAEALGASTWRLLLRHVLPGVLPVFLVSLSGGMAAVAGTEIALSWLGLGVDPETPSFGALLNDAASVPLFRDYPHLLLGAGVPVVLFFFAWNLLGDALVDLAEPRTRGR